MIISLLVLLVPTLLVVGGYQLISGRTQPVPVDPAPAVATAAAAGLPAAAPEGLEQGWVPVSAVFQPGTGGGTLRIGYVTPDRGSAQVVQSTVPVERLLVEELPVPRPVGTVEIDGQPWQRHDDGSGQLALVRLRPDLTTIVLGSQESDLRELAAALE